MFIYEEIAICALSSLLHYLDPLISTPVSAFLGPSNTYGRDISRLARLARPSEFCQQCKHSCPALVLPLAAKLPGAC